MIKKFNITGTCIPEHHYMADVTGKLDKVREMVTQGDYFTINRPRQYGKTTIMYLLEQRLKKDKDILTIDISFEGIDTPTYEKHEKFIPTVLNVLRQRLAFMKEVELVDLIDKNKDISDFSLLSDFLSDFIVNTGRKVVLMIDEVDKSGNNRLFLDFLGMLRTKYLKMREGKDHSFHSVILAGVHDVKTLKAKLRPEKSGVFNSPWNIAVDFDVDMTLSPDEITPMLEEYAAQRQVEIDIPFFAQKLYYFTSGYPFLVSYLCKIIDETLLPGKEKKTWQPHDLVEAVRIALTKDTTNFQSLIKNLENNPELYDFVYRIIMDGSEFSFNRDNPVIEFGNIYGVLREDKSKVKIHNRLYEQRIYNYMASKLETSGHLHFSGVSSSYIEADGSLNMGKMIRRFQDFMKEQHSTKDADFLERNGRLIFLAFIRPIINGRGFDFKEVQISEEKRLDIVITFQDKKYIVELKIWRGPKYHEEGIRQLCDYLEAQNQTRGFLLVYDPRKQSGRTGTLETIKEKGKEILAAWV